MKHVTPHLKREGNPSEKQNSENEVLAGNAESRLSAELRCPGQFCGSSDLTRL